MTEASSRAADSAIPSTGRVAQTAASTGVVIAQAPTSRLLLAALMMFFVLEYARPPAITPLRLQFAISSVIPLAWIAGKGRPWARILTAQLLFLVLNVLHTPFVLNNFASYMTARAMYGNFAIALGLSWGLARRDWFRLGSWVWVSTMGYCAIYGLTHGGVGPGGFLRDENDLALGCVSALGFSLFGFGAQRGAQRWLSAAFAILFVSAVVATMSRGGFLGVLAVGLYYFASSRHKVRDIGVAMIASGTFLVLVPQEFVDEMYTIKNTDEGTAEKRKFLWATAFNIWEEYPIAGGGGGNFQFLAGDFQPTDGDWPAEYFQRSSSGTVTHSLYFQLLAEQGLVGAGLLGWLLYEHFSTLRRLRRLIRTRHDLSSDIARDVECHAGALGAAAVGSLAAGAFLATLYYPYLWYFGGMALALDVLAQREMARKDARAGRSSVSPPSAVVS